MTGPAEHLTCGDLGVRRWRLADRDALQHAVAEALPTLRPWLPWATDSYDLDAAAQFLTLSQAEWITGESYNYALTTAGAIIGGVGLMRRIGPGGLEIGYWLHPAHTGRGLMTRAAAAVVDEAFLLPDIQRVQLRHDAANTASAGVARRLGFTEIERREGDHLPGRAGVDVVWERIRSQG